MPEKIYMAGAISGLTKEEYQSRFKLAAEHLQSLGYQPVNPCELDHCENSTWEQFMLKDIEMLFKCDAVYFLNNWRGSRGARIEHAIAVETGKKIFYQPNPKDAQTTAR